MGEDDRDGLFGLRSCVHADVGDERGGAVRHFQLLEGDVLVRPESKRLALQDPNMTTGHPRTSPPWSLTKFLILG
jgi:hypothetical protein